MKEKKGSPSGLISLYYFSHAAQDTSIVHNSKLFEKYGGCYIQTVVGFGKTDTKQQIIRSVVNSKDVDSTVVTSTTC